MNPEVAEDKPVMVIVDASDLLDHLAVPIISDSVFTWTHAGSMDLL